MWCRVENVETLHPHSSLRALAGHKPPHRAQVGFVQMQQKRRRRIRSSARGNATHENIPMANPCAVPACLFGSDKLFGYVDISIGLEPAQMRGHVRIGHMLNTVSQCDCLKSGKKVSCLLNGETRAVNRSSDKAPRHKPMRSDCQTGHWQG